MLQTLLAEEKGRVEWHPYNACTTEEEIMLQLDQAIVNNEEGLVIKHPQSTYIPGLRSPVWIKIKPDYVNGMSDMPDLALVGGWYGTGRRGAKVSHYLLAVRDTPDEETGAQTYLTMCKVGSGLTFDQMERMSQLPWKPFNKDKPPKWLKTERGQKVTPDVYLDLQHAPVVQVKAEKFVESAEYASGFTMRFPRIEKVREDVRIDQVMDIEELREYMVSLLTGWISAFATLRQMAPQTGPGGGRLNRRGGDGTGRAASKKRKLARGIALSVISSHSLQPRGDGPGQGPLAGSTFYVMPAIGPDGSDQQFQQMQSLVQDHGGTLQGTSAKADYVIADLPKSENLFLLEVLLWCCC